MLLRDDLDFSGIAPGPMHTCDPCFSRLKYDCLVKRSQALRGRNLTRDSWADGEPMTHQASGDSSCQGPFSLPAIGHLRYTSENPGVWGKAPAADPCGHRASHATFFHEKILLKPAPKASFTELFAVFYPLDREKTQKSRKLSGNRITRMRRSGCRWLNGSATGV